MKDTLKPYPAYKDSAVPWLGELPEHWEVERLRNVVRMLVSNIDKHTKEDEVTVRLCNYVDVYKNERITDRLKFMPASASAEEIGRFTLQVGDVIITKDSEEWNDIGVPALVEHSAPDLVCGYHLAILRPRDGVVLGEYLLRALQSQAIASQFYVAANGVTRYGLSHDAIKSVYVPVPPLPEQTAIVRYLDYMDRRIRRYISAKKKLITLLNEQKQAIIHQAVTRGLDPNVRLKPSGLEWLGDVPEHWDVVRLKVRLLRNDAGVWGDDFHETGTPVLRSTEQTIDGGWRILAPARIRLSKSKLDAAVLEEGDLVITKSSGSPSHIGKTSLVTPEIAAMRCCHSNFMQRLRVNGKTLPSLVWRLLNSPLGREQMVFQSTTTTGLGNLNGAILSNCVFAFPPLPEQSAIVEYLDKTTANIDTAINSAKREIELLLEYRTRLIADVVTGKLDVREAAATLPEEAEEKPYAFGEAKALNDSESVTGDDEELSMGAVNDN